MTEQEFTSKYRQVYLGDSIFAEFEAEAGLLFVRELNLNGGMSIIFDLKTIQNLQDYLNALSHDLFLAFVKNHDSKKK